jgi:hypothetical protein
MRRRYYLGALGAAALGGLAGCTGLTGGDDGGGGSGGGGDSTGASGGSVEGSSRGRLEIPVPRSQLRRGAGEDAIPAIVDPRFGDDWGDVSIDVESSFGVSYTSRPELREDDDVIAVERAGEARAYPLRILNWHEIVNDDLGGPLLVTYCPLCGSGVTAVREVDGEATTFGVSGLLFRNALVMYDELTDSLWSQIAATAIRGERAGTELELVPSALTTWGEFRNTYPDGQVLMPPPVSNTVTGRNSTRNYDQNPYAGYEGSTRIGLGGSYDDDRLHPKAMVVGVSDGDVSRAYPFERVAEAGVVNDTVGELSVVVAVGGRTLVAYVRRVDGETLTFERESATHLSAGGSRWLIASGRAVDGPFEGTRLEQANTVSPEFFFSWKNFHPETEVWGETAGSSNGS